MAARINPLTGQPEDDPTLAIQQQLANPGTVHALDDPQAPPDLQTPVAPPSDQGNQPPAGAPPPVPSVAPPTTGVAPPPGTNPGPAPAGYVPPTTGPFAPGATTPPPGAPGTFAPGSPNDPSSQGNGAAANAYLLQMLNNSGRTDYSNLVDTINKQYGLASGTGLQWYGDKQVIAAAGGGYYAKGPDGKWAYNLGDKGAGPKTGNPATPNIPPGSSGNPLLDDYLKQLMADRAKQDAARAGLSTQIKGLVDKYGQPVDQNDPIIHGQVDAYRANQDRTDAMTREQMAERAHAEGVPVGAFDTAASNIISSGGQKVGQYQAGLMGDELTNRRAALSDMLGKNQSLISEGDQSSLQNSIAGIDAELAQQKLNQGQQGLDQQNNQFYDEFGLNSAMNLNGLDANFIKQLLGLV